ncbi:YggT family protein [Micrococcus sp.]|uniref:YggT family protein n=1 Tax=Micrococcus sp. TaxID=1271 RepID=UPI002A91DBAB|nr:YggT family protein [Micrococcus sp.]MDY6055555.1 YggT family protein [Micrococcus sp.]
MDLLLALLYIALTVVMAVLIVRIVVDVVRSFVPGWRPRGAALVVATGVYRLTDPPLNAVGRFVPPLRLGAVALDVRFLVVFFVVVLLRVLVVTLGSQPLA